ncbi:MAG: magnesium transporter [Candidatus Fimenecus sp.]
MINVEKILELLDDKKYSDLKNYLSEFKAADLAFAFRDIENDKLPLLFRLLPKELAADTFVEIDSDDQEFMIKAFSDTELKAVLEELYVDDAVDIIEEMPASVVTRILKHTDAETRKSINEILQYPEDSAGSIMTTEFIRLTPELTVEDAFTRIRRTGIDKETIYNCYVTNDVKKLIGGITVKKMLLSNMDDTIGEIMDTDVIKVKTIEDQEVVAAKFSKYDLLAIPVVDNENRLVGIITVDDAIDVITSESTEDIEKMAAVVPTDKPYLKSSVFKIYKSRIPWLLVLMISATFTGKIIASFENALQSCMALTIFIPMLMDSGGNGGAQSSSTIIRSLSLGEVHFKDIFKVIWKEARIGFLCGITLAIGNFIKIIVVDKVSPIVALCVCLTLIIALLSAQIIGGVLPMAVKKIGFDPAVVASPVLTTIVDAVALTIYFAISTAILHL